MNSKIAQLLSEATKRPPCTPVELANFIEMVGPIPHQDYLDFIAKQNGCEGPIGSEGYVVLWPIDEVILGTEQVNTAEFAPGLLLFGGDGGNEAFAFDREDPKWPIVMVPLIGMSRNDMKFLAGTFTEFIERLAKDELWS